MRIVQKFLVVFLMSLLIQALPGVLSTGLGNAYAAKSGDAPSQKPKKTRRVPTMSERVFKKLGEANEAMELKDYTTALAITLDVLNSRKTNENEKGQIHNIRGFIYFTMEDYAKAVKEYEIVVAQGDKIPEGLEITTLYTLAQLSFVDGNHKKAIFYMEKWLSKANNPGADPYIFMGQVYYEMKEYQKSIQQIEKGIAVAQERGLAVKENWWQLLQYLYYEQEDYPKVLEILETLVVDFPKRSYWIQYSGILGQQGYEKEQLYALESAHVLEFFEKEQDCLSFSGLLMQDEVPWRAAHYLNKCIDSGQVEKSSKNMLFLGQAWQLASETDKAIAAYEDAAKKADDGKVYERLASVYLDDDQNKKCVTSATNAINKGGLKRIQNTYIVLGMCQFNIDKLAAARKSFVQCRKEAKRDKDKTSRLSCGQWIAYIDKEKVRRDILAADG
ncbi:MAG: hypothetical protein KUG75_05975 [Pseudomonadales bacterium]|nr:hypothetical protein [Pseudomonadales bacterium]